MNRFEDGILNYFLYKVSKSFFFAKKISYYYIINRDSITTKKLSPVDLKCIFFHLKFVFEYSKNTKYDKNMSNNLLRRIGIKRKIKVRVLKIKNNFEFYLDIINEFLKNEFINNNNKNYLMKTKQNILKAQKKRNNQD